MSPNPVEESTLRVINESKEQVSFTVDASKPVTVRVELNGGCPCGSEHSRAGSYVDSDLGR
ncbi:hypothetical protein AB0N65_01635 [Paenarthrobacter sp. NPDC089322]|uniref:hypothetical protein n=1 Tax=Paenarthrobacter sp. NPDC089322 TaxID=3155065 RepID=UPI00341921C8